MRKKDLEKAIQLYDSINGIELLDNYLDKLYKDELDELSSFINKTSTSIKDFIAISSKNRFFESSTLLFVGQLSEVNRCSIEFIYYAEAPDSIYGKPDYEVILKFESYSKGAWINMFNVTGSGTTGGIGLSEFEDWKLLLEFMNNKKYMNAVPAYQRMSDSIQRTMDALEK